MNFDVVIIGSGAGGGMTALSLCEQGFKVCVLERGKQFDPRKDFILNHADWENREDPLKEANLKEQTINQQFRTKIEVDGIKEFRTPLRYHRVHGVGGSTLHYQGEAHRFPTHAFNNRQIFGWGTDWPINYSDLAPYYQQAEHLLGVAGETGNPFKVDRGEFPTPTHALSKRSQVLAKSAKEIGMSLLPNTLALPSISIDGRTPCQHSGGCNFGCIFGAKSSIDQAIIPRAEKTGNLTLLSETRALKLVLDQNGDIQAVECQSTIRDFKITAKAYVLATGAIETPRLMLHSSYANNNDQVGRYFMETVIASLALELEADFQTFRGPPLDSRVWDFSKPENENISGYVLGNSGYLYPAIGPSSHAITSQGIGRQHKHAVRSSFGRNVQLFGIAEQEPVSSNRVTLSKYFDDMGIPKVDVNCAYSERDLHTISEMNNKLQKWAEATPTKSIGLASDSRYRSSATHVGGTCRMGSDPKHSVVDAFGKVHKQSNCYITDASVFVTQGAGDSPSLTIQALALRTADKIANDLKLSK